MRDQRQHFHLLCTNPWVGIEKGKLPNNQLWIPQLVLCHTGNAVTQDAFKEAKSSVNNALWSWLSSGRTKRRVLFLLSSDIYKLQCSPTSWFSLPLYLSKVESCCIFVRTLSFWLCRGILKSLSRSQSNEMSSLKSGEKAPNKGGAPFRSENI